MLHKSVVYDAHESDLGLYVTIVEAVDDYPQEGVMTVVTRVLALLEAGDC